MVLNRNCRYPLLNHNHPYLYLPHYSRSCRLEFATPSLVNLLGSPQLQNSDTTFKKHMATMISNVFRHCYLFQFNLMNSTRTRYRFILNKLFIKTNYASILYQVSLPLTLHPHFTERRCQAVCIKSFNLCKIRKTAIPNLYKRRLRLREVRWLLEKQQKTMLSTCYIIVYQSISV